jgi:hypothetical protein
MAQILSKMHGMVAAGPGQAAAGESLLGAALTLPAGGPWLIRKVWAQVAPSVALAAEQTGGYFRFDVDSGDVVPNPAPSMIPCMANTSSLGALINVSNCPLRLWDVDWMAQGKSVISIRVSNNIAITNIPQWVAGMIFSAEEPVYEPMRFTGTARGTIQAAALTAIGTITLSEGAEKIVGFAATLSQNGVLVAGEELLGFAVLTSEDVSLPPMQLPFNRAFGAGLGATISASEQGRIEMVPLDIPVIGGARINCAVDLNTAVTNPADVAFYIAYR